MTRFDDFDFLGMYPGVPKHGTATSPKDSVAYISQLQAQADISFEDILARKSRTFSEAKSYDRNSHRFDGIIGRVSNSTPGDRLNTDSKNRFVFTCKYGWIDMGHFFRNANWSYSIRRDAVAALAGGTEVVQSFGSDSSFSVEDLESNFLGREFADRIWELDAAFRARYNEARRRLKPPRGVPASSFANIASEWEKLLKEGGAVQWGTSIKVRGQTVEQLVKQDIAQYRLLSDGAWDLPFLGSRPAAGSRQQGVAWQKQQYLWNCLCDGDRPKIRALRF